MPQPQSLYQEQLGVKPKDQSSAEEIATYNEEVVPLDALVNELEQASYKAKIYSGIPELKWKAKEYSDQAKYLQTKIFIKQKEFAQAKAAENIHAAQGSASGVSKAFSDILDSKSK